MRVPYQFQLSRVAPWGVAVETVMAAFRRTWASVTRPRPLALELEFDDDQACLWTDRALTSEEVGHCGGVFATERERPACFEGELSGATYLFDLKAHFAQGFDFDRLSSTLAEALDIACPVIRHDFCIRSLNRSSRHPCGEFVVHASEAWPVATKMMVDTLMAEHRQDLRAGPGLQVASFGRGWVQ